MPTVSLSLTGSGGASGKLAIGEKFPATLESFVRAHTGKEEEIEIALELYRTPQPIFAEFMHFLRGVGRFGAMSLAVNEEQRSFLIDDIPEPMKWAARDQREARLVFPGVARAFASFVLNRPVDDQETALMLASIAASPGRYRYFRSVGIVQSGADVAAFLSSPPEQGSGVVSGGDMYHLVATESTKVGTPRGDVFLSYELGKNAFPDLHQGNALKFGLLRTCRDFGVRLYCTALSGEDAKIMQTVLEKGTAAFPDDYIVWSP
jgi:hypothetical protein